MADRLGGVPVVTAEALAASPADGLSLGPDWFVIPGAGIFARKDRAEAVDDMVEALVRVVGRLPEQADLRFLSDEQNAELLNWDMEKYRQGLAAGL